MKYIHAGLMTLLVLSHYVQASEEEFIPVESVVVAIKTAETKEAGAVTVDAVTKGLDVTSLVIQAFGRKENLGAVDLEKLRGFPVSSIVITHEAGFEATGGHSVNVKFKRAFYDDTKALRTQEIVVIVPKKAKVHVLKLPDSGSRTSQ